MKLHRASNWGNAVSELGASLTQNLVFLSVSLLASETHEWCSTSKLRPLFKKQKFKTRCLPSANPFNVGGIFCPWSDDPTLSEVHAETDGGAKSRPVRSLDNRDQQI